MSIIDNIKEQREEDKEKVKEAFQEAKQFTKDSFNRDNLNKRFEEDKERLMSTELQEFTKTQYKTHIKLMFAGIIALIIGMFITPVMLVSVVLFVSSLVCMASNWQRINEENKIRKNINKR